MKVVRSWTALGVMIAALLCGHASLRAQPPSEPAPADGDSTSVDDEPVPADDDPVVVDDPDKPWSLGVSIEDRVAARELFREGNRLAEESLFVSAAEKFVAAASRWKHPAFYFNLAHAQLKLGQEIEARESLEHALAHGEEPLREKFQTARKQLEEVKRRLGRIRVVCRTRGAEVTLNGALLFTGPGSHEGWVKAAPHDLTAKKAGYQSEARRVTIPAGKRLDVDLSLVTLTQAADASRRWAAWKPWAVAAGGVMVAAGGGVLHSLAIRDFNRYSERFSQRPCTMGDSPACDANDLVNPAPDMASGELTLPELWNRARRLQATAMGSYIAGGALIATSAVLLYLNRPRTTDQRAEHRPARHVAVTPALSSEMVGIVVIVSD